MSRWLHCEPSTLNTKPTEILILSATTNYEFCRKAARFFFTLLFAIIHTDPTVTLFFVLETFRKSSKCLWAQSVSGLVVEMYGAILFIISAFMLPPRPLRVSGVLCHSLTQLLFHPNQVFSSRLSGSAVSILVVRDSYLISIWLRDLKSLDSKAHSSDNCSFFCRGRCL